MIVGQKEVDMQNRTMPMQTIYKTYVNSIGNNVKDDRSLFLSPNQFDDYNDYLGLFNTEPESYFFS